MVAMAFASPLVKKFIDSKTGEERVDMMDYDSSDEDTFHENFKSTISL